MKRRILPLVTIVVGLILLILTFVTPWYSASIDYTILGIETNVDQHLYLDTIETHGQIGTLDVTNTLNLETMKEQGISTTYIELFQLTKYLTIFTVITCLIALIGIAGVLLHFGKTTTMKKLGILFGMVTLVLTIIIILYFMIGWGTMVNGGINQFFENFGVPSPIKENVGFWHTQSTNGNTFSLGPGYGWYFLIIAGILSWLSSFFINRYEK